jgi:hypothetical protein
MSNGKFYAERVRQLVHDANARRAPQRRLTFDLGDGESVTLLLVAPLLSELTAGRKRTRMPRAEGADIPEPEPVGPIEVDVGEEIVEWVRILSKMIHSDFDERTLTGARPFDSDEGRFELERWLTNDIPVRAALRDAATELIAAVSEIPPNSTSRDSKGSGSNGESPSAAEDSQDRSTNDSSPTLDSPPDKLSTEPHSPAKANLSD